MALLEAYYNRYSEIPLGTLRNVLEDMFAAGNPYAVIRRRQEWTNERTAKEVKADDKVYAARMRKGAKMKAEYVARMQAKRR